MTVRTKPVRIFESDHAPLRLLAELERRSPQEVFHAALAEYLVSHRDGACGRVRRYPARDRRGRSRRADDAARRVRRGAGGCSDGDSFQSAAELQPVRSLGVCPREVVDALEWRESSEGAVWSEAIVEVKRWR